MTGFPINPPRAPIADAGGNTTPEWYRFFVQIQRMIGGPSDPFDDTAVLAAGSSVNHADQSDVFEPNYSSLVAHLLAAPAATGAGLTLTTAEVDLGAAKTGGKFTIAGAGMTVGKPVLIAQAVGPYTGKGTRADEAEMDQVTVTGAVTDASTITAYWSSPRRVRGNFKFNYQVSA
jgi:hypothetical protein